MSVLNPISERITAKHIGVTNADIARSIRAGNTGGAYRKEGMIYRGLHK